MARSKDDRHAALLQLRKVVLSVAAAGDGDRTQKLSTLLHLSALMIIVKTNRFNNLLDRQSAGCNSATSISAGDLKQFTRLITQSVEKSCPNEIASTLSSLEDDTNYWSHVWQELSNPKLDSLWNDETTIGYIYQFFCRPERKLSQTNLITGDKSLRQETLIAFTQLYTPGWVSDFLLENTIVPQWRADSSGTKVNGGSPTFPAQELTVLDPCCGAGHFLIRAFNLLEKLYIHEGADETEAVKNILKFNIYGTDIDNQAIAAAALSLFVRALKSVNAGELSQFNLASSNSFQSDSPDNLLGSLNRQWNNNHPLSKRYAAVVTNPPYIGRRLLDRRLKELLRKQYPSSHSDLAAAFVERSLELAKDGGIIGLITQASLLALPSYKELRKLLLANSKILTNVELGPGVFPFEGGEKINSMLLVAQKTSVEHNGTTTFIDLTTSKQKELELNNLLNSMRSKTSDATNGNDNGSAKIYRLNQAQFNDSPNQTFSYRCPQIVNKLLATPLQLSGQTEIRQGLATTDNKRFLRFWWDVEDNSIGQRWFPYVKGAGLKRWHSPIRHLVNWQDDGAEIKDAVTKAYPYLKGNSAWVVKNEQYYFRKGLTFSFIGSKDLSVRTLPAGCIFDVAGSAIFADEHLLDVFLAYLNSSFARAMARSLNPSINFQVGDLKRIPLVEFLESEKQELAEIAKTCCQIHEWFAALDASNFKVLPPEQITNILNGDGIESNWRHYLLKYEKLQNELCNLEIRIDEIVLSAAIRQWQLDKTDARELTTYIANELPPAKSPLSPSPLAFAQSVLYHLIENTLKDRGVVVISSNGSDNTKEVLSLTEANANWLTEHLKLPIPKYLTERFMVDHKKQFSGNPKLFLLPLKAGDRTMLFSSQVIRKLKDGKIKSPISGPDELAVITQIADQMSGIKDWTGADLLKKL